MTGTYSDLVSHVASRDQCAAFLQGSDVGFDRLLEVLNYLLRWVLPFKTPLREFVDVRRSGHLEHLEALREQGIRTNLDLLEAGRTPSGRARLSSAARVPGVFLVALVHRADISRLAYVRGKTVAHLCGGGYDTLEKIARADLDAMARKMAAYYRRLGKRPSDFGSVIPLAWTVGGAKVLPRVVKA